MIHLPEVAFSTFATIKSGLNLFFKIGNSFAKALLPILPNTSQNINIFIFYF
jgi:hypothetical protein